LLIDHQPARLAAAAATTAAAARKSPTRFRLSTLSPACRSACLPRSLHVRRAALSNQIRRFRHQNLYYRSPGRPSAVRASRSTAVQLIPGKRRTTSIGPEHVTAEHDGCWRTGISSIWYRARARLLPGLGRRTSAILTHSDTGMDPTDTLTLAAVSSSLPTDDRRR